MDRQDAPTPCAVKGERFPSPGARLSQMALCHETRNADGNPSYTKWTWTVADAGDAAELDVSWDVYLKTIDRRVLAGPLRRRQLQR